jgi:hypothetical protein
MSKFRLERMNGEQSAYPFLLNAQVLSLTLITTRMYHKNLYKRASFNELGFFYMFLDLKESPTCVVSIKGHQSTAINFTTWPPNRQFHKTLVFCCESRLTKTFIAIDKFSKEPHSFLYTILGRLAAA